MKNLIKRARGFTLIELLVVIAIIALLTGILMTNFSSAKAKSRDAKRISDVGQIQLALALYFDRCKQYPSSGSGSPSGTPGIIAISTSMSNGCPSGITFGSYIAQIPTPTGASQTQYDYAVNDTGQPTDYYLHTTFETTNDDIVKSGLSAPPAYGSSLGITCSSASGSLNYCIGPK